MMELVGTRKMQLLSGRSHPDLAERIAEALGLRLSEANLVDFANGEIRPRFVESMRGADVFILQSHSETQGRSVNDSLVEHWIMIDAAKRASAKRITAVCPYYGYSRQDRKSKSREPITARMVSDFFATAGADRIISVDLHSGQIQGFFDGPVDHLTAVPLLTDYLRTHAPNGDFVMVSPDTGRSKVAEQAARHVHGGDDLCRRRHPEGQWRDRGVGHVHPRRAVRPCRRPPEELGHLPGDRHRHLAAARGEADRQDRSGLGGADLRRCDRRGLQGHVGLGDLQGREPNLTRADRLAVARLVD
jgi:phosphoribosylpyrophosphate synthetase